MTDTAGPFDGTPWAEAQWFRHAAVWAPSGTYGPPAASTTTGDLPLSVSALTVGLGAGRANVRGAGFERTGAAVMQVVSANTHASFSRRDRIVLRRNLATHTVTPVVLTGTPAGTPAAPALTQSDAGSWDLPMFSFLVPPNSGTSISGIVDERVFVDNSGLLRVATMANRPTAGLTTGDRITALDRPAITYAWNGGLWVPGGWPLSGDTEMAPAGAYLRMEGYSSVVTTNAAGAYTIPIPPLSAPPFMSHQWAGDRVTSGLDYVRETFANYASDGITGIAFQASGAPVVNLPVRINWTAFGYST